METSVPVASRAGRDRLSNLPDCLLHGVLSSLRSRQAVHTCLLSRRWRHLWRSVPCLDVDQRDFPSVDDPPEPKAPGRGASDADRLVYNKALKERIAREMKRRRSFEDFADAVLPLNGAWSLDAYRLHVAERGLREASCRWIRRGLERRPEELGVAYGYDYARHGYTYDSYRYPHDDPPFSFDLVSDGAGGALPLTGRLRRLQLSGVTLEEKFAEELASECPVLEELKLVKCGCRVYDFGGRIASRSLKRLHIEGRRDGDRSFMWLDPLAVPALVSLHLDMVFLPDSEDELQSLAAASITYPDYYAVGEYRFLKSLRNARVLELRGFTTTGLLEDEPKELRSFHNLRTLILIECDIGDGCQVLRYVLENVPDLERLVLKDCKLSGRYRGESASTCSSGTTLFGGCKNLRYIQVQYKDHVVPREVIVALTQIAKDVVGFRSKMNSAAWLDWMGRVVSCSHTHIVSLGERYAAASVVVESDDSQSDEEHESHVWKHHARKKHVRDGAIKAGWRAAHLARR